MNDFEKWWKAYDSKHLYISVLRSAFQSGQVIATAAGREACAVLVEDWPGLMQYEDSMYCGDIDQIAHSIRERGREAGDE